MRSRGATSRLPGRVARSSISARTTSGATSPGPTASWCRRRAGSPKEACCGCGAASSIARCRGRRAASSRRRLESDPDMAISIHLKVYEGGKLKLSRLFRSEQIRIGSGSCDLVLEGNGILPSHAVIDAGASGAVLRAVGPAPLYLNGQPIIAAPLRHGDLISVGDLRVMVELRASAAGPVPEKRPRLQLIEGEADWERESSHAHPPALAVVRDEPLPRGTEARSDRGIHAAIPELPAPEPALLEPELPEPELPEPELPEPELPEPELPEPQLPEPDLPETVPEPAAASTAQPVVAVPLVPAPA